MCYIVILTLISSIARQTDWMGGSGVLGPVSDWKTQYYVGDSITPASEGQVSLVATQWDYTSSGWAKHTVESNSGIPYHTQGLMPADIDGDGTKDLVAHSADEVVWYSGNYVFSKNVIGPADDGGCTTPCVYPCDLDNDDDIDVLVATEGVGVGWFEQQSLIWTYHSLDNSIGYHRVSAVDIELDGDIDMIAVDNKVSDMHGAVYLFRDTTGTQNFKKELIRDFSDNEGWRIYPADFNNDRYPDIYSVHWNTYIFINDSSGYFTQSFNVDYWSSEADFDGAWPVDIDMDGDMDLVCGDQYHSPYGFYALLNDGTGANFTKQLLDGTDGSVTYTDGAMARDIDLDGLPDIAGSRYRVGWFRQNSLLTFTLYDIDDLNYSNWVYVAPLSEKCIPSMDLLVTDRGAHIVYKNQMLKAFASQGHLESSILELPSDSTYKLNYFGYEACVPNNTALAFYWRVGADSTDIVNKPWDGPHSVTTVGIPCVVDSFLVGVGNTHMFQYKAEFRDGDDIAVLYNVWLTYEYDPSGIEEQPVEAILPLLRTASGKLALYLPREDKVKLAIYDVSGKRVKLLFDGHLVAGTHNFELPKASGIYFAKLRHTKGEKTLKFIKLR